MHCKSTADYSTGGLSSLSLHARMNKAILGKSLMPEHELLGVAQKIPFGFRVSSLDLGPNEQPNLKFVKIF